MASMSKTQLIGNLGNDPESRNLPSGETVCNFSIATTEKWTDKQGNKQEQTEWHRISCFGKLAEICAQYLKKGSSVYVEGKNKTRKWQAQDGTDRYSTEVVINNMQMLGSRQEGQQGGQSQQRQSAPAQQRQAAPAPAQGFDNFDDDIPF